jgi:hypothetical protein
MALARQILTEQQQGQEQKPSLLQQFAEYRRQNLAQLPKFGAEMGAMFREGVKDVQNTFHQVMWGQPAHPGEPGTPLNPTPQITTAELTGQPMTIDR